MHGTTPTCSIGERGRVLAFATFLDRDITLRTAISWYWCADWWCHDQLSAFATSVIFSEKVYKPLNFLLHAANDLEWKEQAAELQETVKAIVKLALKLYKPPGQNISRLYARLLELLWCCITRGAPGVSPNAWKDGNQRESAFTAISRKDFQQFIPPALTTDLVFLFAQCQTYAFVDAQQCETVLNGQKKRVADDDLADWSNNQ